MTRSILTNITEHASYDPLLGTAEAAEYLGCHPETLKLKARTREIAVVRDPNRPRGHLRFRLSALNAWAKRMEQKPLRSA